MRKRTFPALNSCRDGDSEGAKEADEGGPHFSFAALYEMQESETRDLGAGKFLRGTSSSRSGPSASNPEVFTLSPIMR